MRAAIRFFCGALIASTLVLFMGGATAKGQPPPCTNKILRIVNNSLFNVDLCFWSDPAIPCVLGLIPMGARRIEVPDPFVINGIRAASGTNYPFGSAPAPHPPFWIPNVALLPSGNCFNVFFDPANCTITIKLAGPPPCNNP